MGEPDGPALPPAAGPLASIVIPVWNRADTLGRAIASVLAQTEPDLEVIVVDNGSDDARTVPLVVARCGDARVRVVRLPENEGPSGGRNAGVAAARGRLVGFLDSDDELEPTWLAELAGALGDATVATCGFVMSDANGERVGLPQSLGPAFGDVVAVFQAGTMLMPAATFARVGGYDERLWYAENTDLGLRLASDSRSLGTPPAAVELPLFRWHKSSARADYTRQRLEAAEVMLTKHSGAFARDRFLLTSNLAVAGVNAARLGERRRAVRHFWTLLRRQPKARNVARLLAATTPVTARLAWRRSGASPAAAPRRRRSSRRSGWWYAWRRGLAVRWSERRAKLRAPKSRFGDLPLAAVWEDVNLVDRRETGAEQRLVLSPLRRHPLLDERGDWARTRRSPTRTVVRLRHGRVFGAAGWVGLGDQVVTELGNARPVLSWRHRSQLGGLVAIPEALPGATVSLAMAGFTSYAHWMLQGLPRLSEMLDASGGPGEITRFLYAEAMPPFVSESLRRLRVDDAQLHRIAADALVECEELVTASFVGELDVVPAAYVAAVRHLYADALARPGEDILFVTRRTAPRRHLVNEHDVLGAVTRLGGRLVSMDGLDVAEQARIFSSARLVVAVHGGALANCVFLPATAGLLEILPANYPSGRYATLARSRGLAYDYVVGTEPMAPRSWAVSIPEADVRVDVKELRSRIEGMLR